MVEAQPRGSGTEHRRRAHGTGRSRRGEGGPHRRALGGRLRFQPHRHGPPYLAKALDADAKARAFFDKLNLRNRYALLYRIQNAKRPETRARLIAKFTRMCARGETIH